jgi:hypothetical protein
MHKMIKKMKPKAPKMNRSTPDDDRMPDLMSQATLPGRTEPSAGAA